MPWPPCKYPVQHGLALVEWEPDIDNRVSSTMTMMLTCDTMCTCAKRDSEEKTQTLLTAIRISLQESREDLQSMEGNVVSSLHHLSILPAVAVTGKPLGDETHAASVIGNSLLD